MLRQKTLNEGAGKILDQIWKPEVTFPFSSGARFHTVPAANLALRIAPGGHITYDVRMTMDLHWYPMDRQVCRMWIASVVKPMEEMELHWHRDSESLENLPLFPKMEIDRLRAVDFAFTDDQGAC